MKQVTYKTYKDTNYIVLSDGTMARLIKPIVIHNQKYYNPIINKKMKRINTFEIMKWLEDEKEVSKQT